MADTRRRMIDAAIHALQHRGFAGMSFTEVLHDSGAARGAIYHHFPGGKAQLVAEAAACNGDDVRAALAALPADDPRTVVAAFLDLVRPVLTGSAAGGGCAVAAITVGPDDRDDRSAESRGDESDLRRTADRVFASWVGVLRGRLEAAGLPSAEAADLATTLVMLLEGAHVMCRAAGSLDPFEHAVRTALALADRGPA